MAYDFELLTVETSGRVATVIIDNPPANVITKQKVTDNFVRCYALHQDTARSISKRTSSRRDSTNPYEGR